MTLESSKERARQLFVDRSTMGLDSADESELRQLLLQQPTLESEDLELAAAAVALAAAQADLQDLPSGLYDRLERQGQSLEPPADDGFGAAPSPVVELKSWRRAVASPWLGLATAATLLLSLGWYFRYANTPIETQCMLSKVPVLAQAQEREELLQAADVRTAVWQTATGTSGDLAEIEWAVNWSYGAAGAETLTPDHLAALPPEQLASTALPLKPSARLVRSEWPVHALRMNPAVGAEPERVARRGESVLVIRPDMDVIAIPVSSAECDFLGALLSGKSLGEAAGEGLAADPAFDIQGALARHLAGGHFARTPTPQENGEQR